MYEEINHLGENMNTYNPMKAAEVARTQGFAIAHTAGLYSTSGLSNIAAPSVEVLNQNGYSIYVDDNGNFNIKQDRDTKGGTIWTSDSLGVTFDYTGDTLVITPTDDDETSGNNTLGSGNKQAGNIADQCIDNFTKNCESILNKQQASQIGNGSYNNSGNLNVNETVDPYTGQVVDKEKSEAVNKLLNNESVKFKFDKLINLINKTGEARYTKEADYKFTDGLATSLKGAAAGAAGGAAIGVGFLGVGAIPSAIVGGIAGLIGGICTAVSDSKDTKKLNEAAANEAASYANELNAELEQLLQDGNEEEFIAFERYFKQQTGANLSDVLKSLDTTDDSDSAIAQASGFDSEYILDKLEKIDDTNSYLEPDKTTESNNDNGCNPQIEILERKVNLYHQAWVNSLSTGKVTVQGKEMTSDEIEKLYLETYEEYQNAIE